MATVSLAGVNVGSAGPSAASANVTIPGSTTVGDYLVIVATSTDPSPLNTPAGWKFVTQELASSCLTTIFYRVAQIGDAGSVVNVSFMTGTGSIILSCGDYTNVAGLTVSAYGGAAGQALAALPAGTSTNGLVAVVFSVQTSTSTTLSGWTNSWNENVTGGAVEQNGFTLTTQPASWTGSNSANPNWTSVTLAFSAIGTSGYISSGTTPWFNSSSVTCNAPIGLQSGDLLIIWVGGYSGNGIQPSWTTPSGWTSYVSNLNIQPNGTFEASASCYYKIASGSEPSTYSVSVNQNPTGMMNVACYRYVAVDGTGGATANSASAGSASNTFAAPNVTTSVANELIYTAFWNDNGGQLLNMPSGSIVRSAFTTAGTNQSLGGTAFIGDYSGPVSPGVSSPGTASMQAAATPHWGSVALSLTLVAQKWTAQSNPSGGDRLSSLLKASRQLSDGTLVWLDGDGTSNGVLDLCYSSDHLARNVIAALSTGGGNFFYPGTNASEMDICVDNLDNIYVFGAQDGNGNLAAQAFVKGVGHSWTQKTLLFGSFGFSSIGSGVLGYRAWWANTGGGTGSHGHIMLALNDSGTPHHSGYATVDAGVLLAGSGSPIIVAQQNPTFFGAAAPLLGGNLSIAGTIPGATSGLAVSAFNSTHITVGAWAINSSGTLTTNTNITTSLSTGTLTTAGSGSTRIELRCDSTTSNWALFYPSPTNAGQIRCQIYSSSAVIGSPADCGTPTNWPTPTGSSAWDIYSDPIVASRFWAIAWSTATNSTGLGLSVLITGGTVTWATSATTQDSLIGSGGTNSTLRVVSQPTSQIYVDWQTSNTNGSTLFLLGDYSLMPSQVVGMM